MSDFNSALEDWIDDNSPHLAILTPSQLRETSEFRHFAKCWYAGEKAESRRVGAIAAAVTRAANKSKGITQKGLKGSTVQKRWASTIRGQFISTFGASSPIALQIALEGDTPASFWITNRNRLGTIAHDLENLAAKADRAAAEYDAKLAALGAAPGQSVALDDEARQLLADLRAANKALWSYLG